MRFARMRSTIILFFFFGLSASASADLIKERVTFGPVNAGCTSSSCNVKYRIEQHHEYNQSVTLFRFINSSIKANNRRPLPSDSHEFNNTPTVESHHIIIADTQFGLKDDAEENEFGLLVNAPGVEITYYTCIACHSERIIAQQGLSRQNWDEMLDWMVEEQGMSELDEQERVEILDYLSTHYNEDRPNFPHPNKK